MWLFLLWWLVDDTLASTLGNPGIGQIPWWVVLILSLALTFTVNVGRPQRSRE